MHLPPSSRAAPLRPIPLWESGGKREPGSRKGEACVFVVHERPPLHRSVQARNLTRRLLQMCRRRPSPVVHLDIKGDNVLVDRFNGIVKLTVRLSPRRTLGWERDGGARVGRP